MTSEMKRLKLFSHNTLRKLLHEIRHIELFVFTGSNILSINLESMMIT